MLFHTYDNKQIAGKVCDMHHPHSAILTYTHYNSIMKSIVIFFVVLIIVMLTTIGFLVLRPSTNPGSPTSVTPPAVSTPTPTTPSLSPSCNPSDLKAIIATEGGAGNIYGTLTLQNISTSSCTIIGNNFISATSPATTLSFHHQGSLGPESISLAPHQTVYSQVHFPNGPQCPGSITQSSIIFKYLVSSATSITFTNANGKTSQPIQICSDQKTITTVDLWSIYLHPVNQ